MSAHARLSPSAASRWMVCTMAPSMEENIPDQSTSYTKEGTQAHELAEFCARTSVGLSWGAALPEAADQEMEDAAEDYAAYIKETFLRIKETCPDAFIDTEIRLDLTDWIPDSFGTADCLIVADDVLHVIDFKYGKGVKVEAENNVQMMIYALGALDWAAMLYEIKTVKMTIVQPRLGGISEAEISADHLLDWGENILQPIAAAAASGNGVFKPSEQTCKFCKASGSCSAQAEHYVSLFEENPIEDVIDAQRAGELLRRASGMDDWLKAIKGKVFESLMDGSEVPGWKLVEGRSVRRYTDEVAVAKAVEEAGYDPYEKKVLGITAMTHALGKKKFNELLGGLVMKPAGKPTLVPESDKRPAMNTAKDDFTEVENNG